MDVEKDRIIKINLDLTETDVFKNETYQTNETFWTTDVNSAYLEFSAADDLTDSTASLVLKNVDDGSLIQRNIEVSESPFVYKLRAEEVIRAGRWFGQVVVESEGKALTAAVFRFKIKSSLLDSSNPALVDIDNYRKLSDQLTTLYDQMNTYVTNTVVAEESRETAEVLRKTVFEESQRARKLDFEESEKNRSIVFSTSENDRNNLFKQNEETRQSSEDGRVLAENNRRTAFEESQSNRTVAFNQAESSRNETFNANEKTRQENERERKQAELLREETYDSKVDAAIVEADVVTKVDDKVAELSPTIQNVTAQLAQTQKDFDTAVGAVTVDSEVVLARGDEITLVSRLNKIESEKANKKQEEWITPTLLNGIESNAGNPVQYMKDEFGFVHFRGRFTNIKSAVAFMLPIGYRPKTVLDLATQRGILASIWVNGTVVFSSSSSVSDNSIAHFTFRGEG